MKKDFDMKHRLSLFAGSLLMFTIGAVAETSLTIPNTPTEFGQLTGNLIFTSNYVWRGISQTRNGPAVQGGLTYTLNNGLYASLWGSNVSFPTAVDSAYGTANLELDPGLGFANKFSNGVGYDLEIVRYTYPKMDKQKFDYNEAHVTVTYSIFNGTIAHTNNFSNTGGSGTYYTLGAGYDVPAMYVMNLQDVNVGASIGHYALATAAGNSYNDYSLNVSKKLTKKLKIQVSWTGTNGKNDCYPLDKDHIFGALSLEL
jgi:uncharacterized protein (TIGR02001 family)